VTYSHSSQVPLDFLQLDGHQLLVTEGLLVKPLHIDLRHSKTGEITIKNSQEYFSSFFLKKELKDYTAKW
jgi:hypothetical protein